MKNSILFFVMTFSLFLPRAFAERAVAQIKGTQGGSPISGSVVFTQTSAGMEVSANVYNVPPGKHGFHIHEKGSCEDAGNAAGGHFNPDRVQHGLLHRDGMTGAHAGDFGNIEVKEDGSASLQITAPQLTLKEGKYAVQGLAVILHEKEDDFGQPTGNAGGRIGCGIITLEQ